LDVVEKNLKRVTAYSIRYLKALLRKYGEDYPRRTKVEQFKEVEVRKLTAKELSFCYDREKGYIGYDVEGDPMFECSSLDKVLFLWDDGSYKVMQPPDKFFADKNLIYAAPYRRGKIMTMVYNDGEITYMKRFKFGGVIMNRDYLCTPEDSKVLLFTDAKPKEIYVKYKRAKRQRINQQVFHTDKLRVSSVKAKGSQMTVKTVRWISTEKPRNWNRGKDNPRGALID
jgi:topoisomerase-4 subunit A